MPLDALLRDVLAAPDDAARADAAARLAAYPDALPRIAQMLWSPDEPTRVLALHVITRLAPPPPLFGPGILHRLREPMGDPLGDEIALVLVCCGRYPDAVAGARDVLAARVRTIDRAEGPRAPTLRRLAHDTLAIVDHAIASAEVRRDTEIASLAAMVRAGKRADAETAITAMTAGEFYPELARATRWEAVGDALAKLDRDAARFCFERAHHDYQWHASGATAGGEGLARMLDVDRLAARLRAYS